MADYEEKTLNTCDSRIWCEECRRSEYKTSGDKYLCSSCGRVLGEHGIHHEIFPHLSGDLEGVP